MARWISARLVRSEAASIPGRIFAVQDRSGWFPALLRAKSGARVRGTLCELRLAPGDLARLDRYEGREYHRISLPVRTGRGALVVAQVYLWRSALPSGAPAIAGGDFTAWLRRSQREAFTTRRDGA